MTTRGGVRRLIATRDGIRYQTVPAPACAAGQLAIRAAYSLISAGTELHYARLAAAGGPETPLGYCSSGTVEAVGEGVADFAVGQRVVAMGWSHALHAEHICVPARLCARLDDGVAFSDGVFAALAATALHAVHRARMPPGARALIVGGGLIGQLVAQCAVAKGAIATLTDVVGSRVEIARAAGLRESFASVAGELVPAARHRLGDRGADVIFLCVEGEGTALVRDCIELLSVGPDLQRRGAIVVVGRMTAAIALTPEVGNIDVRYSARCGAGYRNDDYAHARLDVTAPLGEQTVTENLDECARLIAGGGLRPGPLITHRIPFAGALSAHAVAAQRDTALAVLIGYQAPEPA
jgi:threonine dehydrogenase-like Zn-dependent dehydrogenase